MSPILPDQPNELILTEYDRRRSGLERYVYVIAFSSGTVKVGQTRKPQNRLAEHANAAAVHGHSILRNWVSSPHEEFEENERALIAFCAARWETSAGREAFADADFDAVVEFAYGLPFNRVPDHVIQAQQDRAHAIANGFRASREDRLLIAAYDDVTVKTKLIASLTNDENRWSACDAAYELLKGAIALTAAPWALEDPTAAERYLTGRGTNPSVASKNATEFELNFRTLFAMEYKREADSFEEIARFCDSVTGPTQGELGGAA